MKSETSKHLVYGLIDPRNGELRYVGKSSTGMHRPNTHKNNDGRKGKTKKDAWLRQLWGDGNQLPSVLILKTCETAEDALAQEVILIAMLRDAGFRLTNLTNGGEGMCGHKLSAETCAKMSLSAKNVSDRVRAIRSDNARRISKEDRKKWADKFRGFKHSEETKAKMRGRVYSETHRKKLSIARRKRITTKETCERIKRSQLARWARIRDAQNGPTFDFVNVV